jgi:hypothetical protein
MEYLTAQTKRYLQSLVSYDTFSKAAITFSFSYRSSFPLLNILCLSLQEAFDDNYFRPASPSSGKAWKEQ